MTSSPMSSNRDRLVQTALRLLPLLPEAVFVGGQMAELLVTDPGALGVRPTVDVDIVVGVTTRGAYHDIQMRLMALGFEPDTSPGAPICRTRTQDGLVLDAMQVEYDVLGFTNRWYSYAIESANDLPLAPGLVIQAVTAPAFLATKWEAFTNRGAGDALASHDVEDIVTVVAGRPTVVDEVRESRSDVHEFIRQQTRAFLGIAWAEEIIESAVPDARRFPELRAGAVARFHELASD
jgi:hypothetical protein